MKARKLKNMIEDIKEDSPVDPESSMREMSLKDIAKIMARKISSLGEVDAHPMGAKVNLSMVPGSNLRALIKQIAVELNVEFDYTNKGKTIELRAQSI